MRHLPILTGAALAATLLLARPAAAQAPARGAPVPRDPAFPVRTAYSLAQFGPFATPDQAQQTLDRAAEQLLAAGGGVILIPRDAPAGWTPKNQSQGIWLNPPAPAPSNRGWGKGPGVTVLDARSGTLALLPPQVTGLEINRILNLPKGQSLPHWDYQPMVRLHNVELHAGTNAASGKGRGGGILGMDTWSHNENQTFDVMVWRRHYSQGDSYIFDARFSYMGNGQAANGSGNSVLYSAAIESDTAIFRGTVERWDPAAGALTYRPGARADTLGSGRPIVNLNPGKWFTNGTVAIHHPGGALLGWAGTIRSTNAGWTEDVVGRYFAVDEPGEYVPGGDRVRRWFLITRLNPETNGVQSLNIQRHWWGAKDDHGVGRLYKPEHYTTNPDNPRPLRYIIAPGALAYDVSDAVQSPQVNPDGCARRLLLAPAPFYGAPHDFAPGDPIEQAMGPDPFKPIAFRSWLWDSVPGLFPAPILDVAAHGPAGRHAVFAVAGGSGSMAVDTAERYDRNPPFQSLFTFRAAAHVGLRFKGDVGEAAILFAQPRAEAGMPHELRWSAAVPRRLGVQPDGVLTAAGRAPLAVAGQSLAEAGGLSATAVPARNLRGRRVPVPAGARRVTITFPTPEPDSTYAVRGQSDWPTACAVAEQTPAGFTLVFDVPAPENATVNWLLMR